MNRDKTLTTVRKPPIRFKKLLLVSVPVISLQVHFIKELSFLAVEFFGQISGPFDGQVREQLI